MDRINKFWHECKTSCHIWHSNNWHILLIKIIVSLPWFLLIWVLETQGSLINTYNLKTFIYLFSIVGAIYSSVSVIIFSVSKFPPFDRKYKEKDKFCWFTVIYMLILIIIDICFREYFHLIKYNDIIKAVKGKELLSLISLMASDLMLTASFLVFYFYFCFRTIKNFRFLLSEKALRSILVALTAWLLIATNVNVINTSHNEINKLFVVFYIIFSSITTLLYPFFDIFEFTYKQLDKFEKDQEKRILIENVGKANDVQKRASKKWNQKSKKSKAYITRRSLAKNFILKYATEEDLENTLKYVEERKKHLKNG